MCKKLKFAKYIKEFILDSKRELIQIFSLIICLIMPSVLNFAEKIGIILGESSPTIDNAKYYYLMISGNQVMGIVMSLYFLFHFVRKWNKETVLNKRNIYHNKPYWWYWICSKVLGYHKCNLILVPIYTQYKLILRDTFDEYPFEESLFPQEKREIDVYRNLNKENVCEKEINLIIQDTYPINENQIPSRLKMNNTISIKRSSNHFGERIYCKELVDNVVEEIRTLDNNIKLNIFSTTNPKNTYEIVKKAIGLAERGNVKNVYVFQQNNKGMRAFKDKAYRII